MGDILVCERTSDMKQKMLCGRERALLMRLCRKSSAVSDVVFVMKCVYERL